LDLVQVSTNELYDLRILSDNPSEFSNHKTILKNVELGRDAREVRTDEGGLKRSDSKSNKPPTHITNGPSLASLATPLLIADARTFPNVP